MEATATSAQIAKHFREVFFGGNWTCVNLKDTLSDITYTEALAQVHSFNTIATLTYHIAYFVKVVKQVLQGGPLEGNDKLSFNHPQIQSEEDWQNMLKNIWADAEVFILLTEQLPDEKLPTVFEDAKYGNYYRNLFGIIEHTHYHLGQITFLKKLIREK